MLYDLTNTYFEDKRGKSAALDEAYERSSNAVAN